MLVAAHKAKMLKLSTLLIVLALPIVSACTEGSTSSGAPEAPTMLTAEVLSGGAHLVWKDNSDNETQFMIMRMEVGGAGDYTQVASPPFDTSTYHDAPLTAGKTYMYMVMAMNDTGESQPSNEVMIAIP
ncbi:hypothetical protein BH11MYX2_BH11MYX2_04670 [soil metagenome]